MNRSHRTMLVLAAVALLVACANLVPRKGWDASYGPVVPHDTFPADCSMCHEGGSWSSIKPDFAYDHEKETGVALLGVHRTAQCLLCHNDRGPVKQFADKGCRGCHEDVHRGRLGSQCQECHNEDTWRPLESISRHSQTRFPLVGAHAAADCTRCHVGAVEGNFEVPSVSCESCHVQDSTRSKGLDHASLGLVSRCDRCHTPVAWKPAGFEHPGSFALSAGHAHRSCSECHTTPGAFTGLSTDCASCHLDNYQATTDPNHAAASFSTNCTQCHSTSRWPGARFDHPASFALSAGHANRSCSACHTTPGTYAGLTADCVSCHMDDFQRTSSPNHAAASFGTNCTQCHNTTQWQGADFQHPATFALSAGHANRSCTLCHTVPGTYSGLSTDCSGCHLDDFQHVTNPNHVTGGFSTTCTQCHTTTQWQGASFQHPATFALSGGHANRACTLCHTVPGTFTGLTTDCAGCHLDEYQVTTDPNHAAAHISTTCTPCHGTTQWAGATFNHPSTFALNSGHAGRSCNLCHTVPGTYAGLTTDCAGCHLDDFQRTTNPNHVTGGFSTNCTQCHNTTQWQDGTFQHTSAFPLTNGHANRACTLCHTVPGTYTGLTTDCASCHLDDFQRTTDPNHVAASFPTNCTQCHTTTQWPGATFNHATSFPLTQGHANRACNVCHATPGVYTGLSTTCSSCHLDDYQRTTNPNHVAAGFPTNCTQCHTTTQWPGATFNHPGSFPLTSAHANRTCNACHTVPGVYTGLTTACVSCHLDDYQRTTKPNHALIGYPTNCVSCHTPTLWTNGTFNHPRINRSNHSGLGCADCHTVAQTTPVFSCTHCHQHNRSSTDKKHSGVDGYLYVSTSCYQCHK